MAELGSVIEQAQGLIAYPRGLDKDFLDALQAWKRDTRARENDLVHFAIYGLSAGEDDEHRRGARCCRLPDGR
jgi:hypothetical protein